MGSWGAPPVGSVVFTLRVSFRVAKYPMWEAAGDRNADVDSKVEPGPPPQPLLAQNPTSVAQQTPRAPAPLPSGGSWRTIDSSGPKSSGEYS